MIVLFQDRGKLLQKDLESGIISDFKGRSSDVYGVKTFNCIRYMPILPRSVVKYTTEDAIKEHDLDVMKKKLAGNDISGVIISGKMLKFSCYVMLYNGQEYVLKSMKIVENNSEFYLGVEQSKQSFQIMYVFKADCEVSQEPNDVFARIFFDNAWYVRISLSKGRQYDIKIW